VSQTDSAAYGEHDAKMPLARLRHVRGLVLDGCGVRIDSYEAQRPELGYAGRRFELAAIARFYF
jgi:hypothetical protein